MNQQESQEAQNNCSTPIPPECAGVWCKQLK